MIENVDQVGSQNNRSFRSIFCNLFEIDVRSLAAFRMVLGLLILADLGNRIGDLDIFLTDQGILPAEMAQSYIREFLGGGFWSLYWIDGSNTFTLGLLGLTAIAAVGFAIGLKTRLMNVLCLILIASLQLANPLILTGGHVLLRVMLFWSVFLPMGVVWSVDSRLTPSPGGNAYRIVSVATMAIMLQLSIVYFFSGIAKLNDWWFSGIAVETVLSLDMYVKPLGGALKQYPQFLAFVTYTTLIVEIVGPILLFVPQFKKFNRSMVMAMFWLMHIGVWLTMSIGIFSLLAMACWLVFVPYQFWENWSRQKAIPPLEIHSAQTPRQLFATIICSAALVYVLTLNVANINHDNSSWFTASWRNVGNATLVVQEFALFGNPPIDNPDFEYEAELANGSNVDLFELMYRVSEDQSGSGYQYFPTQHWRRIHSNLMTAQDQGPTAIVSKIRHRLLGRIVLKWNRSHDPDHQVVTARLHCNHHSIIAGGTDHSSKQEVWAEWNSND